MDIKAINLSKVVLPSQEISTIIIITWKALKIVSILIVENEKM
jgi:hypothetical protein